jgi:peptidoglycan/LPS O-acetylase OafA/YrhL
MSWSYRPALDGLRTVAVYLVLLFHTGWDIADGGFIGVDLFFVLSGFLVSNVILSEVDRTGRFRLGHFYARRVRRLLPAAVVVIVATSAVFVLVTSAARRLSVVGDAQSSLLYVANWRFLLQSEDYFAENVDESPFLHFWSLAIEEQFYLVFPVLLLVLLRFRRRRTVALLGGLGAVFLLSLGAQVHWARVDATHAYYGTDARLYQLLAGVLLAVALRTWHVHVRRRHAEVLAVAGLGLLLLLGSGLVDMTPSWRGIGATVASVLVIAGLSLRDNGIVGRALARPVPVFLGRISYGTYLWHWPVILVLQELLATSPRVVAVLTVGISTGLAALSYEVVERPVRTAGFLDRFRWRSAVVGVAVSALVAVTLVPWLLEQDRRPVVAGTENGADLPRSLGREAPLPRDVDWEAVRNDNGLTGGCTVDDVSACTLVEGAGPHLLLVGDSQAQMLGPMFERIAREHDLRLSVDIVAGCPWQEGLENLRSSSELAEECERFRVGWYDEVLPRLDPDVVVLVSRPRDDESWQGVVVRRDGEDQSLFEAMTQTSDETLAKIAGTGARAVVLERMIMPESFEPTDCLSAADSTSACAVPVPMDTAPTDAFFITRAADEELLATLDLNPAFCPGAPLCQPVVGGEVVWRDDHHVTATFAESRAEQVWRILRGSGVLTADR